MRSLDLSAEKRRPFWFVSLWKTKEGSSCFPEYKLTFILQEMFDYNSRILSQTCKT